MEAMLYAVSMKKKTLTIKDIPADVLRKYRAWCNYQGVSMTNDLIEYMREKGEKVTVKEQ